MSDIKDISRLSPQEIRNLIREGKWDKPTAGLALGYAQANVVILPARYAFDFFLFCQRNPKPCPLLEVLEPGRCETEFLAPGADIRTDVPSYHIFRHGDLNDTKKDIRNLWQEDFVTFLLGCSFTFEQALLDAHIPVRHIEEKKNIPMYVTHIPCRQGGIFRGPLIVTMRPIPYERVTRVVQITSRYPFVHGAPVHIGSPERIGIKDLSTPDFGEAVKIRGGEVPLFWACGVTPQKALLDAKPEICITHVPGHMFISDIVNEELATL
ncbi:MAG: putative hydro-lyase [Deltaproteobacteria bacterium]|nr:putative hydro-lyase [Deltaproteobacteria bacterium]